MTLPLNVSRNIVGSEMVLTTPYHAAIVEWAHQHGGRWDKERRAWLVAWSQAASESFDQLCATLWPSGVAEAPKRWARGRAEAGRSRASEASTQACGTSVSTAGSVETCARCHAVGFSGGISSAHLRLCSDCWRIMVDYVQRTEPTAPVSGPCVHCGTPTTHYSQAEGYTCSAPCLIASRAAGQAQPAQLEPAAPVSVPAGDRRAALRAALKG